MASGFGVVHVYKGFPPARGGIEGHIDLLARLLAERGIRSEVLCAAVAGAPAAETHPGVHVRRCATPLTVASTPLTPTLPAALRRSSADLVHLHYPWPPAEVAWVLGGRGRALVVTVHCEAVRHPRIARLLSPLTQQVCADAGRILVSGEFMRGHGLLARHQERVRVVPFGVDLEIFRPNPAVSDPLPHVPHPRILFVGRLRHYKGLPVLVRAVAQLPEAHLVVAGDGRERGALVAALQAHGCRERAHLLGEVEGQTLVRLLQTADALALPSVSRAEAFGLAVAEAQACGVPAVVTDVGTATTYTVNDGLSGRIVPPGDPAALGAALAWCVDARHSAARRAAARAHAEAKLCGRRMAAAIEAIYAEALDDAVRRRLRWR
jgi:glycosyltransferase involved in cell wall biosynthesis